MRLIGEVSAEVRARHVHHLVSVLHRCRHPDGSGPVEVHVREVVAQLLHDVWAQSVSGGKEIHEVRGCDCTLVYVLRYKKEVLKVPPGDCVVHDYARLGVVHFHACGRFRVALESEDSGVDPLLNDDEVESGVIARRHSRV